MNPPPDGDIVRGPQPIETTSGTSETSHTLMESPFRAAFVFVAPVLPLDVRMMVEALEQAHSLQFLVTSWCFTERELGTLRPFRSLSRFAERRISPVSSAKLVRSVCSEWLWRGFRAAGGNAFHAMDSAFAVIDRQAARRINEVSTGVIGREDCCLNSFRCARERGLPRLYVLPTAHVRTVEHLLRHEQEQFPEAFWCTILDQDFAEGRIARKKTELEMATEILCPSSFVHYSLLAAGVSAEKISTIPLGADDRLAKATRLTERTKLSSYREPVFLYAGNVSARKGVHRLLNAWRKLKAYRTHRLRLIGNMDLPESFLADYRGTFEHVPRLLRRELILEYGRAQCFVFNALADGFGHVFAEAMLAGTPVLASRNCGAPDLITSGREGLLFDYGNDEQLCAALDWSLSHPRELEEMGIHAQHRAFQWGWREFQKAFIGWALPPYE